MPLCNDSTLTFALLFSNIDEDMVLTNLPETSYILISVSILRLESKAINKSSFAGFGNIEILELNSSNSSMFNTPPKTALENVTSDTHPCATKF